MLLQTLDGWGLERLRRLRVKGQSSPGEESVDEFGSYCMRLSKVLTVAASWSTCVPIPALKSCAGTGPALTPMAPILVRHKRSRWRTVPTCGTTWPSMWRRRWLVTTGAWPSRPTLCLHHRRRPHPTSTASWLKPPVTRPSSAA